MLTRILIIESNREIACSIGHSLSSKGYQVNLVSDGTLGFLTARATHPDLILVGWNLNGLSCLEICSRLRVLNDPVPVIVLTSSDQVSDRISALNTGADDCLSHPLHLEELIARMQVQLRRFKQPDSPRLRFSDLLLDQKSREVFRGDSHIDLTTKEFDFLNYFMNHPRQVLTRNQIIENVWGYEFLGTSNIVEVYIRYLRRKLENVNQVRLIHTVRGIGYVLRETA